MSKTEHVIQDAWLHLRLRSSNGCNCRLADAQLPDGLSWSLAGHARPERIAREHTVPHASGSSTCTGTRQEKQVGLCSKSPGNLMLADFQLLSSRAKRALCQLFCRSVHVLVGCPSWSLLALSLAWPPAFSKAAPSTAFSVSTGGPVSFTAPSSPAPLSPRLPWKSARETLQHLNFCFKPMPVG